MNAFAVVASIAVSQFGLPMGTINGRVLDEHHQPVPDVEVIPRLNEYNGAQYTVGRTDHNGNYTVSAPKGSLHLILHLPSTLAGHMTYNPEPDIEVIAGSNVRHDIVVITGVRLRGRVLLPTGKAASDGYVQAVPMSTRRDSGYIATINRTGHYLLCVPAGDYHVIMYAAIRKPHKTSGFSLGFDKVSVVKDAELSGTLKPGSDALTTAW